VSPSDLIPIGYNTGRLMTRQHLLCVVNYPANSGFAWNYLERVAADLAVAGTPQGWAVFVAYPAIHQPPDKLKGSPAIPIEADFASSTPPDGLRQARLLRDLQVDSVYFIEGPAFDWRYPLYRAAGVRRITAHYHSARGDQPPRGVRRLLKRVRRGVPCWADRVITNSDFVRDRQIEVMLTRPERVSRIWNAVETPPPTAAGERSRVRSELGIPDSACLFVAASRAAMEKGVDLLFQAFDQLGGDAVDQPWLVFVGDGVDFGRFAQLRLSLGAASRIVTTGYRNDVSRIMGAADVFVHAPVCEEAFGLVVLEAMHRGLPCICTRSGGVPELVRDGVEGLIIPREDVPQLSQAMHRLWREPRTRQRYGAAAQQRARAEFSRESMMANLANVVFG
jgi:glycosyltransferase involved in cell wall biosynthesis